MKWDYIDWIILIFVSIVIVLILGTGWILYQLIFALNLLNSSLPSIATAMTNIVLALVSIIAILFTVKYTKQSIEQTKITIQDNRDYNEANLKKTDVMIQDNRDYNEANLKKTDVMIQDNKDYNQKNINQTTRLIEQNEENSFIQLRFHNAETALYNLMNELQITLLIHSDLESIETNELFLNSRGFLLVQYLNFVSDTKLLEFIPLRLRGNFQYPFLNRLHVPPNSESDAYVNQLNSYDDYNRTVITQSKIIRHYEFEKTIKKFNENCISGHFVHTFKLYYSSCITEQEMFEHMRKMIVEIANHKPEELILEEKDLQINDQFYS